MSSAPVAASPAASPAMPAASDGYSVLRLRSQFEHYATTKTAEIEEQRESARYYHGKPLTSEQLKVFAKRKQPVIVFNRTGRKVDGTIGIVQKLRGDPKVFPKGPSSEEGAELANNVIRSVIDAVHFASDIETDCLRDAAVYGTGVCELDLPQSEG